MVDQTFFPAIRAALQENEIGDQSPYKLSYARYGASGASFGIFQGDTHVDARARDALRAVLEAYGADAGVVTRIIDAVSLPCPNGSPLSLLDQQTADKALSSDGGRAIVDQMDEQILTIILQELDTSLSAAQDSNLSIEAAAQISLSLWVNMTGAPTSLNEWIKGATVGGVAPPTPPKVRRADVSDYLKGTKYFKLHPRNLVHFEASVDVGVKKLPAAVAAEAAIDRLVAVNGPGFVNRIVAIATDQWHVFGDQTYDLAGHATHVGHKEGDEGYYQKVGTFWLDGTNTHGLDGRNHGHPWSAAFISWVMKTGGAGTNFRYSTQHSVYIYQAIRDRQNSRAAAGFWGWRLNEYKPLLGDLVCWSRQAGIDYDHQNGGVYAGHCDIVVGVEANQIIVIGGNVGDSVTRRPLPLNEAGFLPPVHQGGEILFAVMQDRIA